MKKAIFNLSTAVSFALLALFPKAAFADSICPPGSYSNLCNLTPDKAGGVVSTVIIILFVLAIITTLFFLIWGGIRWTASGGDKAKVQSARSTIIAAIVGLVISLLSYFIVNIVLQIFTGNGISSLSLPTLY